MTYEIGQKVNTPLGVGELYDSGYSLHGVTSYLVRFTLPKNKTGVLHPIIEFPEQHLKPYKTAHERLLEMGFKKVGKRSLIYKKDDGILVIEKNEIRFYNRLDNFENTVVPLPITLELSRILTQYLEEMVDDEIKNR